MITNDDIDKTALLAAIVASTDDAIIGKTLDGIVTSWNAGAEAIYGYTAEDVQGQSISMIVPPERMDEWSLFMSMIRQNESVDHHETIRVRKDGTRINVSLTLSPIKDASGTVIGASAIARDITRRKQVEHALQESQRAMATLISNLQGLVYRGHNTPDRPFTFVSEGCLLLTGYAPRAFLDGEPSFGALIHPGDRETVWEQMQEALLHRRSFMLTYRIITATGEKKWAWEQGQGIFDADDTLIALEGFISDITALKRVEDLLRREKRRSQKYLDVAGVMFVVIDRFERVSMINQKGCDVLGYRYADIVLQNWFDCFIPERLRETVRSIFGQLLRGDLAPAEYFENPVLTRDGQERLVAWHNTVIRGEDDDIVAILSSGTDITEQRRLEREILEISGREQRRIGRELHDGLGSHLTGLAMILQSLARRLDKGKPIEKEEIEEIAVLAQEGSQQARLLARGLNPVKLSAQGLQAALQELALTMQKLSGVTCSFESDSGIPPLNSEMTLHVYRIAQEAVNNALKHAHAHHIGLRLSYTAPRITLTVRDDGVGLPAAEPTEGIGLRIMQYRARMIGATFRLQNAPGGGTLVTCTLSPGPTTLTADSTAPHPA